MFGLDHDHDHDHDYEDADEYEKGALSLFIGMG